MVQYKNMKEIEIKILNIDVSDVIARLAELGAEKTYEGNVKVVYFDYPNHELRDDQKRLRLRDFGNRVELTFKKKISNKKTKIADEFEVNVSDFEEAHNICKGLGLQQCREYTKKRISYSLPGVTFELDTLNGCPTFLEIEADTQENVFSWVEKLGFKKEEALPLSGTEVLAMYK